MFSGLRSRWITPRACAAASPSAIALPIADRLAPAADALADPVAQRLALEQLHDGDGHAADDRQLVDREDVRVRQRRDGADFGLEPAPHLGIGGDVVRHDLERDVASEPRIARAIDVPHPAGAERRDDFVLCEMGSWGKRHCST